MDAPKCKKCNGQTYKNWVKRVFECPCGGSYKLTDFEDIEFKWKDSLKAYKIWKTQKDKELLEKSKPKKVKT